MENKNFHQVPIMDGCQIMPSSIFHVESLHHFCRHITEIDEHPILINAQHLIHASLVCKMSTKMTQNLTFLGLAFLLQLIRVIYCTKYLGVQSKLLNVDTVHLFKGNFILLLFQKNGQYLLNSICTTKSISSCCCQTNFMLNLRKICFDHSKEVLTLSNLFLL